MSQSEVPIELSGIATMYETFCGDKGSADFNNVLIAAYEICGQDTEAVREFGKGIVVEIQNGEVKPDDRIKYINDCLTVLAEEHGVSVPDSDTANEEKEAKKGEQRDRKMEDLLDALDHADPIY